jgi:hypothetical protein
MSAQGEAPARECGSCHMCCKVFPIPETGKRDYDVCPRLVPGKGCSQYETRPQACRDFFCAWMQDAHLPDEWKPCNAGFVLHDPPPWAILASCDVDDPGAWQREPYHGQLHDWARQFSQGQYLVGVRIGDKVKVLLKEGEVDLG